MKLISCLHCVLLTDYLPIRAEQLFQILLFHVGGRQIPNKYPPLQISRIAAAAGAGRGRAVASSARHDSTWVYRFLFFLRGSQNAWKSAVRSRTGAFKLSSEILKRVSDWREEIKYLGEAWKVAALQKVQIKMTPKIQTMEMWQINVQMQQNLKRVVPVESQILRKPLKTNWKTVHECVRYISLALTCTTGYY